MIEIKNTKPIYIQSFLIRGIAGIICGAIANVHNWKEGFPFIIFEATSFWIIFDLVLNILRKKSLLYKGKESGWLDDLFFTAFIILKLVALFLLVLSLTRI